ncbi:hypothetical protein BUALT_Bualt03G0178300 [Buddleja alternifolia]|uniref:Uncharacterized protein n=1 Tax=Buddleja alternifolia TaxID=168488 RepID=A0AAV6XZ23_9LAMI|nr:hypothetical protein BUALT_Bualt03G0178300 [Buddleja alternifolia]
MAKQVKAEVLTTHITSSSSNKLERNASKPRGSGSSFKCIGLGVQIRSERDEERSAVGKRIGELEGLLANRHKEIFMLNAILAANESMPHDVIQDLLGVKLNTNNYAVSLKFQLPRYKLVVLKLRN